MSIKIRISLILLLIAVAFGIASATLLVGEIRAQFQRTVGDQLFTLVARTAAELDDKIEQKQHALVQLAQGVDPGMLRDQARAQAYLDNRPIARLFFDSFVIVDPKGIVIADSPVVADRLGADYSSREWFQATMRDGAPHISHPLLGKYLKQPIIVMTAPIFGADRRVVGLVAGTLLLLKPEFLGNINDSLVGRSGYFYVVSGNRIIVAHRDRERILTPVPAAGVNPSFDRALAGFEGTREGIDDKGLHGLFSFKRMRTTNWLVGTALPVAEAFAAVGYLTRVIYFGTALVIVITLPLIWLALRRLFAPLDHLREKMTTIVNGAHLEKLPPPAVQSRDETGELALAFNCMVDEISARSAQVKRSEAELREITSALGYGVCVVDAKGAIVFVNAAAEALLHWRSAEILGQDAQTLFHHGDADGTPTARGESPIQRALASGVTVSSTRECFSDRQGLPIPVELVVSPVLRDGRVASVVAAFHDISEKLRAAERLEYMALHDPLTGLPNRRLLNDRIAQASAHATRRHGMSALMLIDLDGFKAINDLHGHDAGDAVLQEVGRRLSSCVRGEDTVARLGGDEFVVLLKDVASGADAGAVADKIIARLALPIVFKGQVLGLTASVGLALWRPEEGDAEALLKRADAAMYAAKQAGKNRWQIEAG